MVGGWVSPFFGLGVLPSNLWLEVWFWDSSVGKEGNTASSHCSMFDDVVCRQKVPVQSLAPPRMAMSRTVERRYQSV